jgi:hypothetical protein
VNCFDCAAVGHQVAAVGVCLDCGAGICAEHVRLSPHWLTRTEVINRVVAVEPPARMLRCPVCQAACEAAEAGRFHRQAG